MCAPTEHLSTRRRINPPVYWSQLLSDVQSVPEPQERSWLFSLLLGGSILCLDCQIALPRFPSPSPSCLLSWGRSAINCGIDHPHRDLGCGLYCRFYIVFPICSVFVRAAACGDPLRQSARCHPSRLAASGRLDVAVPAVVCSCFSRKSPGQIEHMPSPHLSPTAKHGPCGTIAATQTTNAEKQYRRGFFFSLLCIQPSVCRP